MQSLLTSAIHGVHIHRLTRDELLERLEKLLAEKDHATILNVNVHALNLAAENPWFREYLNSATIAFCDGFGVKWAAAWLGQPLPDRFTPPDWLGAFGEICGRLNAGVYLLGAESGVAEKAAEVLCRQAPGLTVSGTHHGYFNKAPGHAENEAVIQAINQSGARVLLIGFGMPQQEQWLKENRDRLKPCMALTVGAALDYVAGTVPRAPRWITDAGFEWLGRLWFEPRRLWRRYLIGNPRFILRVLKERFTRPPPGSMP